LLIEQAAMIMRSCDESVPEKSDREDVRRRYDAVLAAAGAASAAGSAGTAGD
jgi:hypothetical protein